MSIADKVIIVTGGTSGIGEGCTRHFAEQERGSSPHRFRDEAGEALEQELRAAGHEVKCFLHCDMRRG